MAAAGLYQDRGLSPYHSPLPLDSPYTPVGQLQQHLDDDQYYAGEGGCSSTPFASQDTLESSCQYLEPVLQGLGVKQWQLQGGNTVALVNALYELVQQQHGLLSSKEHLQDELQKLKVDVKTADKTIQRLQRQSEQKAQEAGGLNIKLRQLDAWYRDETDRWAAERDQLAKKCAQLEQRHVQFQHELRRKDTEFEKLQKQLAARLGAGAAAGGSGRRSVGRNGGGSSSSSSSNGIQVTGKLTTIGRNGSISSRSAAAVAAISADTRRATKAELEEIHKRVVEAFEADKQELQQDNTALRKALHDLQREHVELLNGCHPAAAAAAAPTAAAKAAAKGVGSSPAALGANPIAALQQMQSKLEALRVRKQRITGGGAAELHQLHQQAQTASERLLVVKLLEASNILEEQEAALSLAMKALPGVGHA